MRSSGLPALVLLVLMVPKLDSRQITVLMESEQRQGEMLEQHIEAELAQAPMNDLLWWRRISNAIKNGTSRPTVDYRHQ